MSDFHPDDKSIVRRTYLDRKPCQPKNFVFPQTLIGPKNRRFNVDWFDTWPWLEYSVEKDAAFCFACYLFKEDNSVGRDAFTTNGFKYWNRLDVIKKHVGSHKSVHSNAMIAMELFKNQKSSIITGLSKQTKETMSAYRTRLEASVETIRWLLLQGLPFRGHDEKESSLSRADESADISDKEQMALCLRYVNKKGEVCERLLGVVHVPNTTSLTLKSGIESLLMEHSLTFSQVRGQGYDGATICKLTQVALAKKNSDCGWLFVDVLAPLLNFVGGSPKRKNFFERNKLNELWKHYPQSLDKIGEVSDAIDSNKAQALTHLLMSFDFVFVAHLMVSIFGITNALNVALQKRDQDIVNAMAMVDVTKINLQKMRDEGWILIWKKSLLLCLNMTSRFQTWRRNIMFRGEECLEGVDHSLDVVSPKVPRRYCARHLCKNFKSEYPGLVMHKMFWTVVKSYSAFSFKKSLLMLQGTVGLGAVRWFKNIGPLDRCTRWKYDPTLCHDECTNNFVESFSSTTGAKRCYPILTLLEDGLLSGILCKHGVRAILDAGKEPPDYISE
ncbi:uncharacterized protein LOC104891221 [Beta vulgaris subsp. vulgaris]|uniref:uncharacterized protein LOC104891221 n=1 Tax=Beta vulgaris subsp. vulgaris TaxID=3555 RepID=UPI002547B115|nr:uncharacterized protein LOC104891221 [Beta vulgaris subsp. vulgaris]